MSETETVETAEQTTMVARRPYQSVESHLAEQETLETDDKGYILASKQPQEKTLAEEIQEELAEVENDDSLDAGEKTYAKRYGDLRSHSAKQLAAEREKSAKLEEQLKAATGPQSARSMDDEALDSFAQDNPEAAEVFTNLAQRETEKTLDEVAALKAELAQSNLEIEMGKAELFVKGEHEDIDVIKISDGFHDWLETKSEKIQDGVYANATDGPTLANIVSAYKAETGISTEKSGNTRKNMKDAAAEMVETKGKSEPGLKEKPVFSAKAIGAMKIEEYEAQEDEILLARSEGRIVA